MAIDNETFPWASMGIEPPSPEDAIYSPGDQPIAGFDNYIKWAIIDDIHSLTDWSGSHGSVHEAGGSQEIDLDGLSIGETATLADLDGAMSIQYGDGTITIDSNGTVTEFPDVGARMLFENGIDLGGSINRANGTTIYDYGADYFHRAYEADEAGYADEAGNAQTLQGQSPSDFVTAGGDLTITGDWTIEGEWTFDETVDGSITHAETADWADEAGHAETAGYAENAGELAGNSLSEILDMADGGAIPAVDVSDDGQPVIDSAEELSFDQSIDVDSSGDTAHVSVESVPEADHADYAADSNRVDGYHAQELVDLAASRVGDDGRWVFIDEWQSGGVNSSVEWEVDVEDEYEEVWDIYKIVIVHENQEETGADRALKFRVNYDARFRYEHTSDVTIETDDISINASSSTDVVIAKTVDKSNSHWPVCSAGANKRSIAEYTIACPTPMYSDTEDKPHISAQNYSGDQETNGIIHGGTLDTEFDDLHAFSLETDHYASTYIQLWGTKLGLNPVS